MHMTIWHKIIFLAFYRLPPYLHFSISKIVSFISCNCPAILFCIFYANSVLTKIIFFSTYYLPTRMHMTIWHHIVICISKRQPACMHMTIWHKIIFLAFYRLPTRLADPFFIQIIIYIPKR